MFKGTLPVVILAFCLLSSGAASERDDVQTIREQDRAWSQALFSKNLDQVMSNYAEDASFLAPNRPIIEGKAKIREFFAALIARPHYSATFEPTRIIVSKSGDMAYELGTYRASDVDAQGNPVSRVGKHLVTWEKRNGQWKVTAESINPD